MGGTATDHRAQGDDGVIAPLAGDALDRHRHLEGSGHPHDGEIGRGRPVAQERIHGAPFQALDDE